jgi:hypothetical protein
VRGDTRYSAGGVVVGDAALEDWQLRADGTDNHWLDGLVGSAVAASMLGATLAGTMPVAQPGPRYIRLRERHREYS